MTTLRKATSADVPAIESLLAQAQLPVEEAAEKHGNFFVAEAERVIVGAGGFEDCGAGTGLLRSFIVAPGCRGQGIGQALLERVVSECRDRNILALYLLTTTAKDYFSRFGFVPITRDEVPEQIRRSKQFQGSCPRVAITMFLDLTAPWRP